VVADSSGTSTPQRKPLRGHLFAHGLSMRYERITTKAARLMRRLRKAGYRPQDIAYEVGCSVATVCTYTRGLAPRVRQGRATNRPHDPARETEIVRRARTETLTAIAESFGLTRERVRQVVVGYEKRTGEVVPRVSERKEPRTVRHLSPAQRLLNRARLEVSTGCWRWDGPLHIGKYPIAAGHGKHSIAGEQYAHRASYRLWVGEIPESQRIVWTCGDEPCINPQHLKAIPQIEVCRGSEAWDESQDCWKHAPRGPRGHASHCRRGHAMSGENLYITPTGLRHCVACRRLRDRARRRSA
jgi:hypothetical protein